ncbi:putative invertase inhibitor [Glycine soja]
MVGSCHEQVYALLKHKASTCGRLANSILFLTDKTNTKSCHDLYNIRPFRQTERKPLKSESEMASRKALNQWLVMPILLMNCFVLLGQCARPLNTEEGEDLVTCKHTFHFQSLLAKTSDLKVLAEIALNLSTTYAADTLSYVHELQSNSSAANGSNNNIYASRCLKAIENLKDSKEALANGDCDQVDTLVSAAMSDAETCEDGFKDMQSGDSDSTSPLTERNRYFSELCSNALAITKLLQLDRYEVGELAD